jgi:hypothetical protein
MVWHTHMLNPRDFLEDTIRVGLRDLWTAGMPWSLVNSAIDSKFNYDASKAKDNWEGRTGHAWDSIHDPPEKTIGCPACKVSVSIPWTTCGMPESQKEPK